MVRLSAIVCAKTGDGPLLECLRRLSFCDEIVVVADRCTDGVREAARRAGAIVIDGIFPLESQRKSAAAAACSGDWILEVAPDELVDRALAWEIRAELQMRPRGDWFVLPIDNYVGQTLVRQGWTGVLADERSVRLFRRGAKSWAHGRLAAPTLEGPSAGALNGAIRRIVAADVTLLPERLGRETSLVAQDLVDAGGGARGFVRAIFGAAAGFTRSYVGKGGWREGRLGFTIAVLAALQPILLELRIEGLAPEPAALPQTAPAEPLRAAAGAR